MTLETTILNSLSDWRPSGRQTLNIADPSAVWTVKLTGDKCDGLGSRLWGISLRTKSENGSESLSDWSSRICERARGLLEALKVYEIDGLRQEAILRSDLPAEQEGQISYFEVRLHASGSASFCRYQADCQPVGKRRQIAFVLTHEITAKLVAAIAH